ncbi:MAG TPA: hypothetical protein VG755_06815 [Nannocystaceae bacterium]|nr:hypothetical protein [Nannocystaceae bacterium]
MRADAKSCPFCLAALHDAPAPQSRWTIALLGLALAGCGTRAGDDASSDSIADGSSSQGSDSAATWSTGDDSVTTVNSAGCMTYAGPSCGGDWSTSEDGQGTAESSSEGGTTEGESSSTGDSSSDTSGTSGESGSDSSSGDESSTSGAPR